MIELKTRHLFQPDRAIRVCLSTWLALCLSWVSTLSWALDARYSGSWYDPAKDGQGFVVQVLNTDSALVTWFTFDTEGQQAWMQAVGRIEGQRMVFDELLRFTGPRFGNDYNPADRQAIASGRLEIEFDDCYRGQAHYKGEGGFPDDTLALTRLTSVAGFGCDGPGKAQRFPLHHGISGAWYAPAQDGQGWMVEVLSEQEALVYWFTYDRNGQQRWMLGIGSIRNERIEVRDLQWATGGRFGPEFKPEDVAKKSWGRVNLRLWPCQGAEVDYVEAAAHLSRLGDFSSVVPLATIDGLDSCPPYVDKWTAARLLDQAAFGPTPADENRVYRLGIEGWIDAQLAMRPSLIEYESLVEENRALADTDDPLAGQNLWSAVPHRVMSLFISASDQLRLRVSWALSQLLVVSQVGLDGSHVGGYFNLLQRNAFGNYKDLLREVTLSPAMGQYLDNAGSAGASEQCHTCIANENYARELLMLFTIGVNKLDLDGSIQYDQEGLPIEAFTQKDVMELARALSGWDYAIDDWYRKGLYPLVPSRHKPWAHDKGQKVILGYILPGEQSIHADLESVLDILINHPNTAPFVSYRLIQHLTTSNPSPGYVRRVASVFRDNGQGISGDLTAVIRAILLDPEARKGDDPKLMQANFGRIREPLFHHMAVLRGLECTGIPHRPDPEWYPDPNTRPRYSIPYIPRNTPFQAPDVFNFYPPNNMISGTNLVSPEHMVLTIDSLNWKFFAFAPGFYDASVCNYGVFHDAAKQSAEAFLDLAKDRYLRGRDSVWHEAEVYKLAEDMHRQVTGPPNDCDCDDYFYGMTIGYLLLGHEFGVIR